MYNKILVSLVTSCFFAVLRIRDKHPGSAFKIQTGSRPIFLGASDPSLAGLLMIWIKSQKNHQNINFWNEKFKNTFRLYTQIQILVMITTRIRI